MLITCFYTINIFCRGISIHLMLMLISADFWNMFDHHAYFNTSHVNVNPNKSTDKYMRVLISIHLMLMLIKKIRYTSLLEHNFNTSHVNVNQSKESFMVLQMLISIHLMLMLISAIDNIFKSIKGFQYISC